MSIDWVLSFLKYIYEMTCKEGPLLGKESKFLMQQPSMSRQGIVQFGLCAYIQNIMGHSNSFSFFLSFSSFQEDKEKETGASMIFAPFLSLPLSHLSGSNLLSANTKNRKIAYSLFFKKKIYI